MTKVSLTVCISSEVHSQLKIVSAKEKRKMWEIVQQCIESYLHTMETEKTNK